MTIEEILDEMENLLLEAARLPLTNKRMIEEDDMARMIDELREALPGELMDANRIISERQRILEEAQSEAQKIVDQAKTYIAKLTDENVITKQAQEQANEILLQARQKAQALQNDARNYADEVFGHLEANLEKALEVVSSAHGTLHQKPVHNEDEQ